MNTELFRIKRPFAVFAFSLLFSYIFLIVSPKPVHFVPVLASLFFGLILTLKRSVFAKHLLLIAFATVFAVLSFNVNLFIADYSESFSGENKQITGTINEIETGSKYKNSNFTLKNCTVDGVGIFGKIKVYSESEGFSIGDNISFTAASLLPRASEGKFLYHSLSSDTFLVAFPDDATYIIDKGKLSFTDCISVSRDFFRSIYSDNLNPENSSVITALITGETADFSPEFSNQLKYSGASHIFAVSGMHLSLWTSFFFLFFKRRAKTRFIPNILAIIFVVFYSVFTGFSPSVLRAGIMLISVFIGNIIKRHADPLNSLGIAGTVLLSYEPFLAGNVSFLLSFIATFALIFFSAYILPDNKHKRSGFFRRRIRNIISTFNISLCVTVTAIPVTSLFFGYTSLLSPLSSVIITPIATASMVTGLAAALIPDGSIISTLFFSVTEFLTDMILSLCRIFGKVEIAVQATPVNIILPWFILSLIAVAAVFFRFRCKQKTFICILTSIAVLLCITAVKNTLSRNETIIYIPGNDNATMISAVDGSSHSSFVFGTGGSFTNLNKTTDYLNSHGILKTDALIIPRDSITENKNTDYLSESLLPERIIFFRKNEDKKLLLHNGITLRQFTSEDSAVSVIEKDSIKTVICTLPTTDFLGIDEFFTSGDILITRNQLPENIDTSRFETIIIMTERDYSLLPENTYSTADGDIEIILKGDSYAVYR